MFAIRIITALLMASMIGIAAAQEEETAQPALNENATIDEIINALSNATNQYETLHIHLSTTHNTTDMVVVDEVWLSQLEGTFREQITFESAGESQIYQGLFIGDGASVYQSSGIGTEPVVVVQQTFDNGIARNLGIVSTFIAPDEIAAILTDEASNAEIGAVETVFERQGLKITVNNPTSGQMAIWVDLETGIVLQRQRFAPDGTTLEVTVVESITFNPAFDTMNALFAVDQDSLDVDAIWINDNMPYMSELAVDE